MERSYFLKTCLSGIFSGVETAKFTQGDLPCREELIDIWQVSKKAYA